MRKNLPWVILIAALAVSLFCWDRLHSLASSKPPSFVSGGGRASAKSGETSQSPFPLFLAPPPSAYQGLTDPRWKRYWASRERDRSFEHKMPIEFYGRVVDDRMLPVVGAKIRFQWTDTSEHGTSERFTVSDGSGQFSLQGVHGKSLGVYIEKQGYYAGEAAGGYFEYAVFSEKNYYQPDRNAPVLFHLRKKGNGEQLSMEHIWTTIPADGTPVRFDLLHGETTLPNGRSHEGRKSPDGQLEIAAVTNTEEYPPGIFDWHAKISVPDGGLVEHDQEFPFEAPEAGYQESVEFNMPSNAPGWKRDALKNYFIRFGDPPKYGRIHVELDGASQHVSLDYWVNPNGSRNLEPSDPKGSSPR